MGNSFHLLKFQIFENRTYELAIDGIGLVREDMLKGWDFAGPSHYFRDN